MATSVSTTQKITPFLWFDNQLDEAMKFYTSIFKNSSIESVRTLKDAGPDGNETVLTATFRLEGQTFMALNGGPHFKFTPAISLFVNCDTQAEVDELWEKLTAGGTPDRCGWLRDKFGLSWQIVPKELGELLGNPNPVKAKNVMAAMMQMSKLDVAALIAARDKE